MTLDTVLTFIAELPVSLKLIFVGVPLFIMFSKWLTSSSGKGWWGEKQVNWILNRLDSDKYMRFEDVYLPHPTKDQTTQIDHLVLSQFGIYVIETKNFRGWIFGTARQSQWTQSLPGGRKQRFPNPLHQNRTHLRAVAKFLDLNEKDLTGLVYFIGDAEFKKGVPEGVYTTGFLPPITDKTEPIWTSDQVSKWAEKIEASQQKTAKARRRTAKEHREKIGSI